MLLITIFPLSGSHEGLVIYLPLTLMRAVWLEQQQLFPEHGGWKQLLFQWAKSSEKDRKAEKKNPPACLEGEEMWHMCSLPHFRDLKCIFKLILKTLQQDNEVIFRRGVYLLLPLGWTTSTLKGQHQDTSMEAENTSWVWEVSSRKLYALPVVQGWHI